SCAVGRPLLGICLGLQLLFEGSSEGRAEGLGLLAGRVEALPRWPGHPIPHMGWAPLLPAVPSPLLPTQSSESWMYFVHSYAAVPKDSACITAEVAWGEGVATAAVWQGVIGACQFHPEKSSGAGTSLLRRWLLWLQGGG
ncbi:MAG: imidazole glycerol phosphate synthase subunit HisH, partial [Cyanobium sp.]